MNGQTTFQELRDHAEIPEGRKTARVRGWRIAAIRYVASKQKYFTARQVVEVCPSMTLVQAQTLCVSYVRKGELVLVRKGIGGLNSVEPLYSREKRL